MDGAAFYFDLASPHCHLIAERILVTLRMPLPWQPVLARELPVDEEAGFRCAEEEAIHRAEVERAARALDLPPLRWPPAFDSDLVMRVATFAHDIGRVVPFAQAAFRQAFHAGRDLSDPDFVCVAAAASELHPRAVLSAAEQPSIARKLHEATSAARRAGVDRVPAIRLGGRLYLGARALDDAAAEVTAA